MWCASKADEYIIIVFSIACQTKFTVFMVYCSFNLQWCLFGMNHIWFDIISLWCLWDVPQCRSCSCAKSVVLDNCILFGMWNFFDRQVFCFLHFMIFSDSRSRTNRLASLVLININSRMARISSVELTVSSKNVDSVQFCVLETTTLQFHRLCNFCELWKMELET